MENERTTTDPLVEELAEMRRRVRDLEASEEKYRTLVEQNMDGIYVVEKSRFTFANGRFLEMLGYTWEELQPLQAREAIAPESLTLLQDRWDRKARGEGVPEQFEFQFLRKDGDALDVKARVRRVERDGRRIFYGCVRDITERKRAEAERERLIAELQYALARIKTLSGLIPICAVCKKIRDDQGYWQQVEVYVRDHTGADFSHGICPECFKVLYPEYCKDHPPEAGSSSENRRTYHDGTEHSGQPQRPAHPSGDGGGP